MFSNKTIKKLFLKMIKLLLSKEALFSFLSGLLLSVPYFVNELFFLPLIALAPYTSILLRRPKKRYFEIIFYTCIFTVTYFTPIITWISVFHPIAYPFIIVSYCFIFSLGACIIHYLIPRFYSLRFFILPSVFTILEHLKTIGPFKISVGHVGLTLHHFKLFIQSANIFGVLGISFLVYLLGILLADFILSEKINLKNILNKKKLYKNTSFILFCTIVLINTLYGLYSFNKYKPLSYDKTIKISLIQHWYDYNQRFDSYEANKLLHKLKTETHKVQKFKPNIIVYSENAWPIDYASNIKKNYGLSLSLQNYFKNYNQILDKNSKSDFLLGSTLKIKTNDYINKKLPFSVNKNSYKTYINPTIDDTNNLLFFNSFYHLDENGEIINNTSKKILVPFGEILPFQFFRKLLQKVGIINHYTPGEQLNIFTKNDIRIAPLICFEDFFSYFTREYISLNPDFFIVTSNDSWSYNPSAGIIHEQMSIFRAIETTRYFVRASNGGITSVINPLGQITDKIPQYKTGHLNITLNLPGTQQNTIYSLIGNNYLPIFYIFIIVLFLIVIIQNSKKHEKNN